MAPGDRRRGRRPALYGHSVSMTVGSSGEAGAGNNPTASSPAGVSVRMTIRPAPPPPPPPRPDPPAVRVTPSAATPAGSEPLPPATPQSGSTTSPPNAGARSARPGSGRPSTKLPPMHGCPAPPAPPLAPIAPRSSIVGASSKIAPPEPPPPPPPTFSVLFLEPTDGAGALGPHFAFGGRRIRSVVGDDRAGLGVDHPQRLARDDQLGQAVVETDSLEIRRRVTRRLRRPVAVAVADQETAPGTQQDGGDSPCRNGQRSHVRSVPRAASRVDRAGAHSGVDESGASPWSCTRTDLSTVP